MLDALVGVVSSFIGIVFGWFLKTYLDDRHKRDTIRWYNYIFGRRARPRPNGTGFFSIGSYKTSVFVVDGNGESEYSKGSINATYNDGSPDSPDDIADRILREEREMEKQREGGNNKVWDGIGVGIRECTVLRTVKEENLALNIEFYKSRYAAFRATVIQIGAEDRSNERSIYQRYLKETDPATVIDFLARHVGVAAVVVTKDNYVLMTQRTKSTGVRHGEYDVSIVEGIEPTKDAKDTGNRNKIDIFRTVVRGCEEELGFSPDASEVSLLGLAVDMNYYQYNFLAEIKTSLTLEEIESARNGRAKDSWETWIRPIQCRADSALKLINEEKMWGFAVVLLYWVLVRRFPPQEVDRLADKMLESRDTFRK